MELSPFTIASKYLWDFACCKYLETISILFTPFFATS